MRLSRFSARKYVETTTFERGAQQHWVSLARLLFDCGIVGARHFETDRLLPAPRALEQRKVQEALRAFFATEQPDHVVRPQIQNFDTHEGGVEQKMPAVIKHGIAESKRVTSVQVSLDRKAPCELNVVEFVGSSSRLVHLRLNRDAFIVDAVQLAAREVEHADAAVAADGNKMALVGRENDATRPRLILKKKHQKVRYNRIVTD